MQHNHGFGSLGIKINLINTHIPQITFFWGTENKYTKDHHEVKKMKEKANDY
jgi:hypothetical protein